MKSLKKTYLLYVILALAFFLYCVAFSIYLVCLAESSFFFIPMLFPLVLTLGLLIFCGVRFFKLLYYEKTAVITEARFISIERIRNVLRFHRLAITVEIEYGGKTLRVESLYPYPYVGLSYLNVDVPIKVGYVVKRDRFVIVD